MRIAVPIALLAIGCIDRHVTEVAPAEPGEEIKVIPIAADLDLLFVIDNSASTGDKQDLFRRNFGNFITALDNFPGGRPNLHIAVVDTTVDIGTSAFGGCPSPDPADNGLFQIGNNCGVDGRFITDVATPNGRDTNYTGALDATFTCMASSLGDHGCGFEAPLEAMKRALDGSRPENTGFVRNGAALAVVFLTDEDDASVQDPTLFTLAGSHDDFRAQPLYAYACDQPISASAPGSYTGCHVRTDSYLTPPGDYVRFLETVKDPSQVMVAMIASPPPGLATDDSPAQFANVNTDALATGPLTLNGTTQPLALQPSTTCTINGAPAIGRPALRLADFVASTGNNGRFYNVCQPDYTAALANVDENLEILISPCLEGPIVEPLQCTVADVQNRGTAAQTEELIPPCSAGGPATCWTADVNSRACPTTISHYELKITRGSPPPDGTETIVACASGPQ